MTTYLHQPVLVKEVIELLNVRPGKLYLDGTIGSGGHALEIFKLGGKIIGLDVDPAAILRAQQRVPAAKIIQANFADLKKTISSLGIKEQFSGILLDLGLSSDQIVDQNRGFSFLTDGPLDMRANPDLTVTAADLVNGLNQGELVDLFDRYGEETWSQPIAKAIIAKRPFKTTQPLADLVSLVKKSTKPKIHPATQVFQALRIVVNDELNNLKKVLPQAVDLLESGGHLVIISFHSLEDRIVKSFMKENSVLKTLTKKPIISLKPHAMLRGAEKL